MSIRAKMMFLRGGFGTSNARILKIIPSVRKLATKTPVTTVVISMIVMSALMPANTRTEGKL
jgi:hypothetical protein